MNSYTVTHTRGCVVIERPIPVDDFGALIGAWEKRSDPADPWLADALLTQTLRASCVLGPRDALNAWRRELGLEELATDETKGDDED